LFMVSQDVESNIGDRYFDQVLPQSSGCSDDERH
jgi:hypothetical protein